MDTGGRKWGTPYLTRDFFSPPGRRAWRDQTLLVMAKQDGRYIAGALNLFGEGVLFGRNWGASGLCPLPAFRDLLLPGHRLRHRARAEKG